MKMLTRLIALLAFLPSLAHAYSYGTPQELVNSGGNTASVTLTGVPSGANIVACFTWNTNGTFTSMTDNGSNMSAAGSQLNSTSNVNGVCYYDTNVASGSHTITATQTSYGGNYLVAFYVGGAGAFDGANGNNSNFAGTGANAVLGGSVTTTAAGDAIIGFFNTVSGSGTLSAGTSPGTFTSLGFTSAVTNFGEYYTQASAGAIQAAATTSSAGDIISFTIAFRAGSAGSSGSAALFNQFTLSQWQTITTNTTLSPAIPAVLCNAAAGAITVTIPTAVGSFQTYYVKKIDSTSNACTLTPQSGQTIENASTYALTVPLSKIALKSDSANWWDGGGGVAQTTGTFTAAFTGFGTGPSSCTVTYTIQGYIAVVNFSLGSCTATSNSGNMTITNWPAALQPATITNQTCALELVDNGNGLSGEMTLGNASATVVLGLYATNTVTNRVSGAAGNFTSSGTKGIDYGPCVYSLQ